MTLLDTVDAEAYEKQTEDTAEVTPWQMTPVGQYGNRLTRKVVSFIAEKTGRMSTARQEDISSGDAVFSDTLKEAQRTADETDDKAAKLPEDEPPAETPTEIKIWDDRPENPENPEGD